MSADATDAAVSLRDAALVDASPLPVVCASSSCATALVTTFGDYIVNDDGQGFCALLHDRTVACWGANVSGQLGRGEEAAAVEGSSTPARVAGLERVVALDHSCAVDEDGATWCWGTGPFLQSATNRTTTLRTPVKLALPSATRVGVSPTVGCAATGEGVLCWGYNFYGQIAPFDTMPRDTWSAPRKLDLPAGAPVRQLAVGDATFIVREDGSALTLGASPPIGRISSMSPDPYAAVVGLDGISAVDIATDNACTTAGGIGYCWGAAMPGAVDTLSRAYPKGLVTSDPLVGIATTRTVTSLAGSQIPYRWCAVTVSGDVDCWGFNESGQAGNGSKDFATDAVRVVGLPERAVSVKVTRSTSCALLTNGKIYCWGSNFDGQLGNGNNKGLALIPEEVVLP
ncbi:RCC1 domain-containing protein [Labilithrix luteola]|nr:hypothetical protein [Labilithrix luteola]